MKTALTIMSVICFLMCLVVLATIRSKSSHERSQTDRQANASYGVKRTGYVNKRAITGADGETDITDERINRNNFSTVMIQDMRGVSSTSTMRVP